MMYNTGVGASMADGVLHRVWRPITHNTNTSPEANSCAVAVCCICRCTAAGERGVCVYFLLVFDRYPITAAAHIYIHTLTQASLLVGPSMATPLLANHVPWHAARHRAVGRQGRTTTLKWMLALAVLLTMALTRAADPALGGSVWAVVLVGYSAPVVVMCCVVWVTVVDGMALQERLAAVAVGEAIVSATTPTKTDAQQRRRGETTPESKLLRQAVARCENAERRAQQAVCVAMAMLALSSRKR